MFHDALVPFVERRIITMILTGNKIKEEVRKGRIIIEDFCEECCTTNSYDLTLGNQLIRYTSEYVDPKQEPVYEIVEIPEDGMILEKRSFYLGSSKEVIGSEHYVPLVHAKSGIARMGLFVHVTADLVDIGSIGNITFQLYATLPIKVYPGMKIGQATFWVPEGEIELYHGKYQHSKGPQVSKTYLDYKE